MKALIAGITGCAGSHLAEYLLAKGYIVSGTKRAASSLDNLQGILHYISLYDIDLGSRGSISSVLEKTDADVIFYLISAKRSDGIGALYDVAVGKTSMFFETLSEMTISPRIILASSSAVYGVREDNRPINENSSLAPSNHYAQAKIFQENIADYYIRNHNMDIVIARPFNHPGPREAEGLVCADFAVEIVNIERGLKKPLMKVGNLDCVRDLTDVRDVAKAYEALLSSGSKGEVYNICSGKGRKIKDVLNNLITMCTRSIEISYESGEIGIAGVNAQVGDNSKIVSATGWQPAISSETMLRDILDYYRGKH